jgi:RimJ/RimL family protein N-acetyltransferase
VTTATIQTARLILRPFVRGDAVDVFAYASNPNVSRYTTWQTHRTLADSEAFIDWCWLADCRSIRGPSDCATTPP